jgi:hypothetical protein
MTGIVYTLVMGHGTLLICRHDEGQTMVIAKHVRLRDRLRVRLGAVQLDRLLAAGEPPEVSPAMELRARDLIGPRTRRRMGRALQQVARQGDRKPSVVRAPTSRGAVAEAREELGLLAARLLAPAPVEARGVAQVRLLLSDGAGPLYWARRSGELRRRINEAREALEPRAAAL